MKTSVSVPAAGPFGRAIESNGTQLLSRHGHTLHSGCNPLIILHRLAFPRTDYDGRVCLHDDDTRALLRWAANADLGQEKALVAAVLARRTAMLQQAVRSGRSIQRLRAIPQWRLAVGLGDHSNAHEIGLSLHGTYGWPIIPGSSLKGLTAAWASADGQSAADLGLVFGTPRPQQPTVPPEEDTKRVAVSFLDALPAGTPVRVDVDVLTPHVKPYYDATAPGRSGPVPPPAEYHNPVPVYFLTVTGAFVIDLIGADEVFTDAAAGWLIEAGKELGAGAKTSAGYGYLTIERVTDSEWSS